VVAFGALKVLGGGGGSAAPAPNRTSSSTPQAGGSDGGSATATPGPALSKADTKIVVMNATPIPGLAADGKGSLAKGGYPQDNIATGNSGTQQAESKVMYADGARGQAREVMQLLGIQSMSQIDPATVQEAETVGKDAGFGKAADVVVLIGADQTS
jgi:hypothetical protein